MASSTKKLRTGFTTGACAAAAAKAATMLLLQSRVPPAPDHVSGGEGKVEYVEIPFPDGSRHAFAIIHPSLTTDQDSPVARASVIKDAGDDPDVTNKAEIIAEARLLPSARPAPPEGEGKGNNEARNTVLIRGGKGVGRVTKPGLSVPVGEPAINPSPREMIKKAVAEALEGYALPDAEVIEITISVPEGEELAKKTLNARLGIIGGISILGTSGIVRPLSAEAWTSSITAAMDVARATGCREVVLSAGRVSEKAHMKKYGLPVEAYVMMGDYVEFSLEDSKRHGFAKAHISAHWAKMLKISMAIPQTHVRHGAIDLGQCVAHLNRMGIAVPKERDFNTAREIYDFLINTYGLSLPMLRRVCVSAKKYAEGITGGVPVVTHLVTYDGDIITDSE